MIDGEPVQRIAPVVGFTLLEYDIRSHVDAATEFEQLRIQEATTAFDLETGPLIRGRLIQLAADEHALLITMHHIVSDGWSLGVFSRELGTLYDAYRAGEMSCSSRFTVQYADYAAWQRQCLTGEVLQEQSAYWKEQLGGAAALLELPTDLSASGTAEVCR